MRELVERGADTRRRDSYVRTDGRSLRKTLIVLALSFFPQGRTALAVVEEKLSSVAEVGQRYDLADEHQAIRDFLRGRRSEEGGGGESRTHMTVVREHS